MIIIGTSVCYKWLLTFQDVLFSEMMSLWSDDKEYHSPCWFPETAFLTVCYSVCYYSFIPFVVMLVPYIAYRQQM